MFGIDVIEICFKGSFRQHSNFITFIFITFTPKLISAYKNNKQYIKNKLFDLTVTKKLTINAISKFLENLQFPTTYCVSQPK